MGNSVAQRYLWFAKDRPHVVGAIRGVSFATHAVRALLMLRVVASSSAAQGLSAKWEELTGPDFVQGLQASKGTCALPFGIIEKHGPSGPRH